MDWVIKAPDGATLFGSHFLGDWDTCQKYWWFRHRAPHPTGGTGIVPFYKAKPLMIGGAIHDGLAYYLGSGADDGNYNLDEAMRGIAEHLVKNERNFKDKSERNDVAVECEQLMENYHEWYGPGGKRQDFPEMRVLVDREGPVIEREFPLPLGDNFYFTCRVDAIVRYQQWLYVLEHKTSSPYGFSRLMTTMRTSSSMARKVLRRVSFASSPLLARGSCERFPVLLTRGSCVSLVTPSTIPAISPPKSRSMSDRDTFVSSTVS